MIRVSYGGFDECVYFFVTVFKGCSGYCHALSVRFQVETFTISPGAVTGRPAAQQPFRYLCVLDIEATCERNSKHYKHEVIEFPVVVLDLEKGGVRLGLDSHVAASNDCSNM